MEENTLIFGIRAVQEALLADKPITHRQSLRATRIARCQLSRIEQSDQ